MTLYIVRKLGVLRKNATLRIGHQMKRQNSFYVVDVKCLLELQLLLNCPGVRTAARSYLVNTSPGGLAGLGYKEDAVACRVFIQESQIVLLL